MNPLSLQRQPETNYHIEEGKAWLIQAGNGENTTAIAYAAFEFRLLIERIGFQHWYNLSPNIAEENFANLHSFKKIENRIYQLAGNQNVINKRYEFSSILTNMLGVENSISSPDFGKLSRYWQECSEFCHIAWSLVSNRSEFRKEAYEQLEEISQFLEEQVSGLTTISALPQGGEIEKQYIDGEITAEQVRDHFKKIGLWGKFEFDDDRPSHFIGKAVPPSS